MNVLLWTLQISLAAIFTASGLAKISMPRDRLLATGQTGIAPFPMPVVRVTAFSELLGAIGIVVPRLVGVAEFLIPAAAGGLAIVMVGAMASHAHLREPRNVAVNVVIFIAAVALAVGRALGL
ncbi:MAG: DoxX family protein [Mycobacterium sp.]